MKSTHKFTISLLAISVLSGCIEVSKDTSTDASKTSNETDTKTSVIAPMMNFFSNPELTTGEIDIPLINASGEETVSIWTGLTSQSCTTPAVLSADEVFSGSCARLTAGGQSLIQPGIYGLVSGTSYKVSVDALATSGGAGDYVFKIIASAKDSSGNEVNHYESSYTAAELDSVWKEDLSLEFIPDANIKWSYFDISFVLEGSDGADSLELFKPVLTVSDSELFTKTKFNAKWSYAGLISYNLNLNFGEKLSAFNELSLNLLKDRTPSLKAKWLDGYTEDGDSFTYSPDSTAQQLYGTLAEEGVDLIASLEPEDGIKLDLVTDARKITESAAQYIKSNPEYFPAVSVLHRADIKDGTGSAYLYEPYEYARLLKALYIAVKSKNPFAEVHGFGVESATSETASTVCNDPASEVCISGQYIGAADLTGALEFVDVVDLSFGNDKLEGGNLASDLSDDNNNGLEYLKGNYDYKYGAGSSQTATITLDKPVWIGEQGLPAIEGPDVTATDFDAAMQKAEGEKANSEANATLQMMANLMQYSNAYFGGEKNSTDKPVVTLISSLDNDVVTNVSGDDAVDLILPVSGQGYDRATFNTIKMLTNIVDPDSIPKKWSTNTDGFTYYGGGVRTADNGAEVLVTVYEMFVAGMGNVQINMFVPLVTGDADKAVNVPVTNLEDLGFTGDKVGFFKILDFYGNQLYKSDTQTFASDIYANPLAKPSYYSPRIIIEYPQDPDQ